MLNLPYPFKDQRGVYIKLTFEFQYIHQKIRKSAKNTMNLPSSNLQLKLTADQARVLQLRMPKGYSLLSVSRNKRESSRNQPQALSKGKKRDVSSESSQGTRQRKKPVVFNDDELLMNRAPKTFTAEQRKLLMIMQKMRKHPAAHIVFRSQDTWQSPNLVSEQLDLLIIEQNVKQGSYNSILQFWADVRKVFSFIYLANPSGTELYLKTTEMEAHFDELYQDANKPIQKNNFNDLQKKVDKLSKELSIMSQQKQTAVIPAAPQKRPPPAYHPVAHQPRKQSKSSKAQNKLEIPMTIQEKKNLGMNIRTLPPEFLKGVWEIVSEGMQVPNGGEELEFDIDTLPVKKTRLLERYVNSKLQQISRYPIAHNQRQSQKTSSTSDTQKINQPNLVQPVFQAQAPPAPNFENDTAESSFSSDPDESI